MEWVQAPHTEEPWRGRVAAAVRARTEMTNVYRRFPVLDPMLPAVLMTPGWPRRRARDLFVQVHDGLLQPAQKPGRPAFGRPGFSAADHRILGTGTLAQSRSVAR
ncbi:PaaX family transcriptional regulator C-terminal domain-containing protein [Streptosporangium sp. OZ121]|uniref:PaaX family transcriptional regulator C-terminal domain-containing protein n=1 Tax=Streptosporangium sp. OZ121 TaxID=3444183 RepID=UPI003F7A4713